MIKASGQICIALFAVFWLAESLVLLDLQLNGLSVALISAALINMLLIIVDTDLSERFTYGL